MDDEDSLGSAIHDHRDYAKRRAERLDDADLDEVEQQDNADHHHQGLGSPRSPAPKKSRGRQRRDPEGGTYISARSRARKAPLPMKLRALPASFWRQPNLNIGPSPGAIFSTMAPLCKDLCKDECAEQPQHPAHPLGPASLGAPGTGRVLGGDARGPPATPPPNSTALVSHSPADTELLFSLFRSVEAMTSTVHRRTRGRPRRPRPPPGSGTTGTVGGPHQDDPCLLGSLTGGLVTMQLDGLDRGISLRGGVSDNNNLAQILSDLVVKL